MKLLIFVLLAVIGLLVFGFATLEGNLRQARRQLEEAARGRTRSRITLDSPNRAAEELFHAMNRVMDLREEEAAGFRRQERALREQIANISHDLRTPLTSILGYLQLLEGGELDGAQRVQYLAVVRERARAMQELISAFYDLTRIEGGSYPLEREQVDLHRTLSELAAQYYGDLERSGLAVDIRLQEGLPPVWADAGAVRRIFTNLMVNAIRHGSGTLRIRLYAADGGAATDFSNDAPGLTQEDAAHVFERFYTADKTRSGQNTGLGMSIVRALARQMGHEAAAQLSGGVFTVRVSWRRG